MSVGAVVQGSGGRGSGGAGQQRRCVISLKRKLSDVIMFINALNGSRFHRVCVSGNSSNNKD